MSFIKKIIKYFLQAFGIGFYRLTNSDAKEFNSEARFEKKYQTKKYLKKHAKTTNPMFIDLIDGILTGKDINLNGKKVADVGCGNGMFLKYVSGRFNEIKLTGYEYVDSALAVCRENVPGAEFEKLDIYQSNIRDKFDAVFCLEVLEHLEYPKKALFNLASMLKDGGVLVITVPNGRLDHYHGHINFWSPESWKVFISENLPGMRIDTGVFRESKRNYALIYKI